MKPAKSKAVRVDRKGPRNVEALAEKKQRSSEVGQI